MSSAEAAEFSKLADTTYRDVNIALANEFANYADRIGVDMTEVIAAANSQPYSHIHQPGIGVGGHCIPVYPHFLLDRAPELSLVARAREVNDGQVDVAIEALTAELGSLDGVGVLVLGLTYRHGVKELAYSRALPLIERLRAAGARVLAYDPLLTEDEIRATGAEPWAWGTAAPGVRAVVTQTADPRWNELDAAWFPELKRRPRRPQQPRRRGIPRGCDPPRGRHHGIGARKMESDETWLTETLYDDVRMSIKVDRVLFDSQTEHQHLVVAESERFGRMFTLDGVTQLTMADEFVYHEMLAHVPILAHGAARDIGIVGGGDGGLVEEVLKHATVEHVTIAELDAGVIDFARTYLPDLSRGAFDDPRVEIVLGDGADFVATTDRRFDVIVVDSTDPIGPGAALFTPEFYANCKRVLQPGGVLVTQNGVPFFQPEELESTMRIFGGLFADATCYLGVVPTYVGGFMAFGWGTDDVALRTVPLATIRERFDAAGLDTRYYTPELHQASFALPRFIGDIVERAI